MTKIVVLTGRAGSGKDTAASFITAVDCPVVVTRYMEPVKAMLRAYLGGMGVTDVAMERIIEGDLKETPLRLLGGVSARTWMQALGDLGRSYNEDLWSDHLLTRTGTADLLRDQPSERALLKPASLPANAVVVVVDGRGPRELLRLMEKAKAGVIKLVGRARGMSGATATHVTETSVDDAPCHELIDNSGEMDVLRDSVMRAYVRLTGRIIT